MISLQEFQIRGTTSELQELRKQLHELTVRQHALHRSQDRAGLIEISHQIEAVWDKIAAVRHLAESVIDEGGGRPSRLISDPDRREIAHAMNIRRHTDKMLDRRQAKDTVRWDARAKVTGAERKVGSHKTAARYFDKVEKEFGDIEGVKGALTKKRRANTRSASKAKNDYEAAQAREKEAIVAADKVRARTRELAYRLRNLSKDRQIKAARANAKVIPRAVRAKEDYWRQLDDFMTRATMPDYVNGMVQQVPDTDRRDRAREKLRREKLSTEK